MMAGLLIAFLRHQETQEELEKMKLERRMVLDEQNHEMVMSDEDE